MNHRRRNDEGMALILATIAAVVILGAVAIIMTRVQSVKINTDHAVAQVKLDEACKAGVDLAIERVWNQYVIGNGNTTGNLASYRVFMQDLVPNNEDLNGNGTQDQGEHDRNGNGVFEISDPLVVISEGEPRELDGGARITSVTLSRSDDLTGTDIRISCTATFEGRQRTLTQSVRIGGELFQGFEYAVLANNINCILCHADFLSLDMDLNTDPGNYGTFDRIKVASLESLLVRPTEAHSGTAGSVYTRGRVYKQNGSSLSASGLASSTFHSFDFSDENGKLFQDGSGGLTSEGFQNAGLRDDGLLEQFANLYMNYPTETSLMTDGNLPERFPAPFPDENENRLVDDSEFDTVMNSANGSITFEMDPDEGGGSITGGVAYGVPAGSVYDGGNALPSASNGALASLGENGFYDGNLILVGTDNDPIVINDTVAVNGDLIIKGPVKGWGQLLVRGNTYVIGDVTYADAPGEFGLAEDGRENGFALSSGGSILMGDYLTIRAKNNSGDTGTWQGKFIDVRDDHKTVTCKDGSTTDIGYFDDGVVDAGWPVGDEGMYSFTTSELMLFNRIEHQKAQADPSYTPRYYRIRPTQPIYEYVGTDEHAISYFDPNVEIIGDTSGAVIHNINPTDYWMSEEQLRHFWYQDELSRTTRAPFKFDGLLYCNNSIFGITRSKDRHKSNTYGEMIIRGSVVTADLGMLVPGKDFSVPREGLNLYYDKRVNRFFRVEDTSQVQFRRVVCRLASNATD